VIDLKVPVGYWLENFYIKILNEPMNVWLVLQIFELITILKKLIGIKKKNLNIIILLFIAGKVSFHKIWNSFT
jgi:hypothetical protein